MKKSKIASLAAGVLLSAGILGACGGGEGDAEVKQGDLDNLNKTGMPIVKEKLEVDGFAAKFFSSQDWNNLMLWDEYSKMTNIDVDWETIQTEGLVEKRNLLITGGNYPEVFFASAFSKTDLIKYGEQGIFLPLDDYIDEYAPNFKKILEDYPSVKQGVTMADGKIYGFPTIYDPEFEGLRGGMPWINEEWLEKLDLKQPETLDEFYDTLKAFKENDPNGNGKDDEKGWGSSYGIDPVINTLRGSFGLNKQGTMNINLQFKDGTEELEFVPATDGYKELLQYLNKLYAEGLLQQDIFTLEAHEFAAEASKGNYGVLSSIDPAELLKLDEYGSMEVLAGADGEKLFTAMTNGLGNLGMFVLTDKAENPEAMVRWMDYFYGEEGSKMFFMGFEGVTYEEDEDGNFEYLEEITDNPDGLNMDQAISEYLTWPGGYYPGIVREAYFQGAEAKENSRINAEKAKPYRIDDDDILPGLNYTVEENDQISAITTDLQTYIDEMKAEFITGKRSFDQWDEYINTLDKMGVDQYLELSQKAYERMSDEK